MKKFLCFSISLMMLLGYAGASTATTYAGTSVPKAKAAYAAAEKSERAAQSRYNTAARQFRTGSFGFYQWIANTSTGWKKADAQEALQVLTKSSFRKYTKKGNPKDATNLNNMRIAVNLFPTLQSKRASDNFFPNLQPPTIRNVYMARAQVNANASSYTDDHMMDDSGCDLGGGYENLAWGYSNPFSTWYDEEKKHHAAVRNYTLKKYGKDIDDAVEWERFTDQSGFDYDAYLQEIDRFGETGHYDNVCLEGDIVTDFDLAPSDPGFYTFERADKVFFGMAYSGYGACHSLEARTDTYPTGYTVAEYAGLFNKYYNSVYPKKELTAYNKAKGRSKQALTTLKKAAKPKKPTAKRSGKKVKVKWKKVKGVSGYQISVSPKKSKTKVVTTTGAKTLKKTIRIRKSKKQYVKVRSYMKINGKRVYSSWSAVKATK